MACVGVGDMLFEIQYFGFCERVEGPALAEEQLPLHLVQLCVGSVD